jgi:antitoxin (DNA-binding transcriptional repressor) of toxin-antitoxin stability system
MGEEVIIANAGNPVAKLVPIQGARSKFHFGSAEGEFLLPEDFNGTLPKDAEDLFWK